jgi:ribosomal-protein-alanine N-acetyltransferase
MDVDEKHTGITPFALTVMKNTPIDAPHWLIETDRLRLRPVTVDDAEFMLEVWNDPDFIDQVADRGIRTKEQAAVAIEEGAQLLFETYGYGPYCMHLKSDDSLIGICGLFKRDNLDCPDIGFTILPDYRKDGFTREAATAVIKYARDVLGLTQLAAITSPGNAPSRGLIEKLGMALHGTITMPGEDSAICLYIMSLAKEWP